MNLLPFEIEIKSSSLWSMQTDMNSSKLAAYNTKNGIAFAEKGKVKRRG